MQTGSHVLVVGGTRGIGRALVKTLASEGKVVSVIGRRPPVDIDQDDVHFWTVDVTDQPNLDRALTEIIGRNGKLTAVVFLQRLRAEGDKWEAEVLTSLTATKRMIERLSDEFVDGQDKSIVVVGSVASDHVLDDQDVGYHAAKAGLNAMCRYYAVRLGPQGIRVNAVSPGTTLKEENREFYSNSPGLLAMFNQTVPLGRLGNDSEVADVISFLAGPKSSFVTGQNIIVDGGINLRSADALARKLTSN